VLRNLLAGALALVLSPPATAEQAYTHPHVVQVICETPVVTQQGVKIRVGKGTAWRLSKGHFASVSHVTRSAGCRINGKPIHVAYDDPFGDFSLLLAEDDVEGGIKYDCAGFTHGKAYFSLGYARGSQQSVSITLYANNLATNPLFLWQMFSGIETVIPGMSGGPILNDAGEVVGSVNAYNTEQGKSWGRSLKETILCRL
jgi:hypothetical protein